MLNRSEQWEPPTQTEAPASEQHTALLARAIAEAAFVFDPKTNSTPDAAQGELHRGRTLESFALQKGTTTARALFTNTEKRQQDRRYTAVDIIKRLDGLASQLRRIDGRMKYVEEYVTRANRVETYVLDQSAQHLAATHGQLLGAAANAANEPAEPHELDVSAADSVPKRGPNFPTTANGPSAQDIEVLAMACSKRHIFAAKLASRMYDAAERVNRNCNGIGKAALSPTRLLKIRELSFSHPNSACNLAKWRQPAGRIAFAQ